jgi:hypothetical protein
MQPPMQPMTAGTFDPAITPQAAAAELAGLKPLTTIKSRWPTIIGAGLTRWVPSSPAYYAAFALLYMSLPFFDYVIFRRLWGLPLQGLAALIKKRIANDVVVGYSGEAYFYAWARTRAPMVTAPFGAVKDVSILSAIAGNAITLAMVAVALPLGRSLLSPHDFRTAVGSAAITFAISLPFLIFSRRVFSLGRGQLWWIFGVHCVRLMAGSFLIALAWHFAMPAISLGMWLFLAAARLLVSRLPLVPNKDLLFANFAILLIGQDHALSAMIAFTSALTLLVHIALIGGFSLHHVLFRRVA